MITVDTTWRTQSACADRPDLFANPALDYSPADADYAHLTASEHAAAAQAKAAAESAAVDHCFGCPVMQQCEAWALTSGHATGVAGGLTENDRIIRAGGTPAAAPDPTLTATIRDRGARHQVDDAAVARLTAAGRNSAYIAEQLECAERTVVRARARLRAAAEAPTTAPITAPMTAPMTAQPTTTSQATHAPSAPPARADVSAPMAAIYAILSDGTWHSREALVAAATSLVASEDALAWWTRTNSISTPEGKALNPAKADTPMADRIAIGARDKVANMLSASARVAKKTQRGGPTGNDRDLFRLTPQPAHLIPA